MKQSIITGVKPTGLPHIGNYLGAIKPSLELTKTHNSFLFIADYHALTTYSDSKTLKENTIEIAAAWLALGVNPEKTIFYKQSDIPEILELMWILSCFTPKGLLNRAHAYKALLDSNLSAEKDPDHNINTGIFTYPVLMAADILLFNAHYVPVGADQKQHVEIARDIADNINKLSKNTLISPTPLISKTNHIIPGIDGKKMSKNYNNTIPIFLPEKKLRKRCMQIITDSTPVESPKNHETCNVFNIIKHFLSHEEQQTLIIKYNQGGLGYGQVKDELFSTLLSYFKEARESYFSLIKTPDKIDAILKEGQKKAKEHAVQNLYTLKEKLGLT